MVQLVMQACGLHVIIIASCDEVRSLCEMCKDEDLHGGYCGVRGLEPGRISSLCMRVFFSLDSAMLHVYLAVGGPLTLL